jgi:hypothetical protein
MDKFLEQIWKYVPAEVIPFLLLAVVTFFGVYYYYNISTYADVFRHRAFLNILIIIAFSFFLKYVNTPRDVIIGSEVSDNPILLIPEFQDDERGKYKTLFIHQLESSINNITKKKEKIVSVGSFIADDETARLTAKKYNAVTVVFEPKVIRSGDNVYVCFKLLLAQSSASKTYSPTATILDKDMLDSITSTIVSAKSSSIDAVGERPLLTRLDMLERRITELQTTLYSMSTPNKESLSQINYKNKYAIVVGIDKNADQSLPRLRYAVSDARKMAEALERYGFKVNLLTDESANNGKINEMMLDILSKTAADDLFLFYYAGNSFRSDDLKIKDASGLALPTYDFSLKNLTGYLMLPDIKDMIARSASRHKLIILDGCHGTAGLPLETSQLSNAESSEKIFQIFSGTQDNEYAVERSDLGGGPFTQSIVEILMDSASDGRSIPMSRLAADVVTKLAQYTNVQQHPKLVTIAGSGEIVLKQ